MPFISWKYSRYMCYGHITSSYGVAQLKLLGEGTVPNSITLGVAFRRALSAGARYKGMASVVCTKSP